MNTKKINVGEYTVKGLKTFMGMEGHGFNVTLYRAGKKVAFIIDSANGGSYDYDWCDRESPRIKVETLDYQDKPFIRNCTPEEAKLLAHLKTLPPMPPISPQYPPSKWDADCFVCELVQMFEEEKRVKRWCKTKTVFRTKGQKEGTWMTSDRAYSTAMHEYIVKKYGDQLECILDSNGQPVRM